MTDISSIMQMWILGNPVEIEGAEYSNERAIYISNHASPIDIFLIMWLTPTGTVGIAKKEVCSNAQNVKEKLWKWILCASSIYEHCA